MSDYFFQMCNARAQLAGTKNLIESLLTSIDNDNKMMRDVCVDLLKKDVVVIEELLSKSIDEV